MVELVEGGRLSQGWVHEEGKSTVALSSEIPKIY